MLPHTQCNVHGTVHGCQAQSTREALPFAARDYCAADVANHIYLVAIQDPFMRTLSRHVIQPEGEAERKLSALGGGEAGGDTLMERRYCRGVKRLPLKEIKHNGIEKTSGGGGGVLVVFYA